ncbi:GNAT family N-acetyltransferase [Paracrocinitomix mangrovi]|uniref:GNAT family N-acetyltransferase n=1 Tax=Paracrocinitomix mangrovi TaxID=2862509 RepID=UPI001EDAB79B|nr:GNAT family N-acetyltransferase [Paracrocinitomix mangrovi]UKN02779.1 GNAT family N-acetyltransferase [Paracrocinitomix mangrovi]
MMKQFSALNNNVFDKGDFVITPIRFQDMESIRQWRNNQMSVLRQQRTLTPEDQKNYFEKVVAPLFEQEKPTQLLFSFLENDQLIGYGGLVNISWRDLRAEMSFLVDDKIAADEKHYKTCMSSFISLIKMLVFEEMKFNRVFTETYDFRHYHISILEENGFVKEGVLRQHIREFNEFHDSIMHGIIRKDYGGI